MSSDLTVYLDPYNEEYTFENTEYNATAVDNCTIEQLYFSINADNAETTSSLEGYKFEAGTYEIIWTAVDNSNNVAVCSSMLNIEKRPTSLSINGTKVGEEQDIIYVEVVLNDELISEGIEGRTIVFSAAGDTESAVTNIEGIAFVELPVTGVGAETLSVSITFEEDEVYLGSTTSSGVVTGNGAIAENTVNVYPNPFSEKLTFKFVSPENTEAQIDIYDPAGRLVRTIFHQQVISGMVYTIEYRPQYENVNYYLYRMKIGNNIYNGKVMYRK